jgi:RNA-directed DNA polymerase
MQKHRPAKDMQTSLRAIANKARKDSKHRFRHLYSLFNADNLKRCLSQLRRSAAPGVDKVTMTEYEANLDSNIVQLVERLKGKRYRAKLVRRKYIQQPDCGHGEWRRAGNRIRAYS